MAETNSLEKRKDSVKNWLKDPYNLALAAILVFAFAVRLYYFFLTKGQPLWWDEAEYMLKAKSMVFGTPTTGWAELNRPILLPWIGALFFWIGLGEIGPRILIMLFSFGNVLLVYLLGKELFNKRIGLIASAIMSIFYIDLFYSVRILVDVPQVFFILLASLLFAKAYFQNNSRKLIYWIIPVIAIGIMFRFTVGVFLGVFLLFLLFLKGIWILKEKEWYASIGWGIVAFLPFMIYSWAKFGGPFTSIISVLIGATGERSPENTPMNVFMQYIKYFPSYMHIILFVVFLIGLSIILFSLVIRYDRLRKDAISQKYVFLLLSIILPLAYFGLSVNHFEDRYLFMALPSVFLVIGIGFESLGKLIAKKTKIIAAAAVIILLVIGLWPMFSYSKLVINDKLKSFEDLKKAGLWIKENSNAGDVIIGSGVPENTYYSERATYGFPNNESDFDSFLEEKKPRYMILTIWERSSDWSYSLPENNTKMKPVGVYELNNKPSTIIFALDYSQNESKSSAQ